MLAWCALTSSPVAGSLHVPGVAGEVDPRVGVEQLADVTIAYFNLLCQTKIIVQKKAGLEVEAGSGLDRTRPSPRR